MKRLLRRLHLLLIRRGVEFEHGTTLELEPRFFRHFAIVVNHRYITFDIGIDLSRGTFTDELHTPHVVIAQQRAERGAE